MKMGNVKSKSVSEIASIERKEKKYFETPFIADLDKWDKKSAI